jgi:DNA polymerase III subunit epsilon
MKNSLTTLGAIIILSSTVWLVVDILYLIVKKKSTKFRIPFEAFVIGLMVGLWGESTSFLDFFTFTAIGAGLIWAINKIGNTITGSLKGTTTPTKPENQSDTKSEVNQTETNLKLPDTASKPTIEEKVLDTCISKTKNTESTTVKPDNKPSEPQETWIDRINRMPKEVQPKANAFLDKIFDYQDKINDIEDKIMDLEEKEPAIEDDFEKYESIEEKIDKHRDRIDRYDELIDYCYEQLEQLEQSQSNATDSIEGSEIAPGIYATISAVKSSNYQKSSKTPKYKQFLADHDVTVHDFFSKKFKEYIVFDLETTGLSYEDDEIIQIGALKVKNDKVIDQFSSYVKPTCSIPSNITAITGITDEMVANADSINLVMPRFNAFVGNEVLVGHNIKHFDIPFAINYGFEQKNINEVDTLLLAKKLRNEFPVALKNMKLKTLKEYFGFSYNSHDALEDCKTNLIIYQKLRNHDLEYKVPIAQEPSFELKGLRFVLTGTFSKPKSSIRTEIEAHGGRVTRSVSSKTDYLIAGKQVAKNLTDGTHSANEIKAHQLQKAKGKIKIISYPDLVDLIESRKAKI